MRHDPIAEPRDVTRATPLRARRQCIPAIHEPATPDPIEDDARIFCAVEVPPVARAIGAEAYRRQVDAQARDRDSVSLDPSHGASQADGMRDARRRRAGKIAADAVKDLDGAAPPMTVASLVLEALERDGVL